MTKQRHPWTSRKLWLTVVAALMIWAAYERSINHIYAVPSEKDWAVVELTQTALHGIVALALGLVGIMGVVQMTNRASSEAGKIVEERIERTFAPKHFDDPSIQ